ncbi:MAG: hypothetical protein RL592_245, partial [Verrucomicrobiota bacterium]
MNSKTWFVAAGVLALAAFAYAVAA